ncbi:MAG: substrate-binding domain-containing protein [Anaerolineae bacterium]|nr:substrate-binding domain-containing protein [Anaerolineae bacterium]
MSKGFIAATLLLVMVSSCSRVEPPPTRPVPRQYLLVADPASAPLLRALTRQYSTAHPHLIFVIDVGDPVFIESRLKSARTALGATTSIPAQPAPGVKWWLADLAMDGIAVVVNRQNPVSELAVSDVRAIFAGERNAWADYGAPGLGDIKVAVRDSGDTTRTLFDSVVMGDLRLTLEAVIMPTPETMLSYIALNPGAIGYAPAAFLAQSDLSVKPLALNGKLPTPENIAEGQYPMVSAVYLIAAREPQDELREFVRWALSAEGRRLAQTLGYATLP